MNLLDSSTRQWYKFSRLPARERLLLLQAFLLIPTIGAALRLLGLKKLQTILSRLAPVKEIAPANRAAAIATAVAAANVVRTAAAHSPYHGNCLKQSLALWFLLRRQGIASDLRIGVRKPSGTIEGHAWVEYQGCALNDTDDVHERFAVFDHVIAAGH